jgi:class 3 adenylate cyclase
MITSKDTIQEMDDTENFLNNRSITQSKTNISTSDYLVAFSGNTQTYCVGLVDIIDSTKICAQMNVEKISRYYEIFLNSMSKILSRFGGVVLKNIGDCLVYYFPETSKSNKEFGFMSILECSLAMSEYHNIISKKMREEKLPPIDYRISADYGSVVLMKSNNSSSIDMVGPPVNMCSKINKVAAMNDVVIGGDLHSMVKHFHDYKFKDVKGFSLGFKHAYPVYRISRKYR